MRHIALGAAAVAALGIGVATQAGATEVPAPMLSGVVTCDTTNGTWTTTYTVTGAPNTGLAVYTYGGQPNAGTVHGLPGQIPASGTFTFTVTGISNGTTHITIDIVAYDANGPHDVRSNLPITGTCGVVTTTTTTTTTVPTMGLGPTVTVPPVKPQVAAPQPTLTPSFPTPDGPLAVTGRNVAGELVFGSVVLGAGIAAVTTSTMVLRRRGGK